MLIAPKLPLTLTQLEHTAHPDFVWLRVMGIITCILGYYYTNATTTKNVDFLRVTVKGRIGAFLIFIVLALFGIVPPIVAGFGVVDFLAGVYTHHLLEKMK